MQYTPTPAPLPGQIQLTAEAEERKAATVAGPDETILNSITWLNGLVGPGWYQAPLNAVYNANARFAFDPAIPAWFQIAITDKGALWFYLRMPAVGKLVAVEALIDGNAGPGGASHSTLPASGDRADLTVYRQDEGDLLQHQLVQLGTAEDPPGTPVGTYDSLHVLSVSGLSETLAQGKNYLVRFRGEQGANALPDELALIGLRYRIELAP